MNSELVVANLAGANVALGTQNALPYGADVPDILQTAQADRENALPEEVDTEVFSAYECRSLRNLGNPHPGDISEPGLLAAIDLPPMICGHEVFEGEVVENTKLSRLQLEGVLYAAQQHTNIRPDGTRAGFFIGDGAGVGKGRQIAGVILDSWARGRRKHVWFSISNDLKLDAQRDLNDIGCHINVIDGCQGLDSASSKGLGMSSSIRHGCLFSTYSTLASTRSVAAAGGPGHKKSRLEQVVDWCGGRDFCGCLIFDEAHKAKNFNSVKEEQSTKISQAVIRLQEMLPLARVVYCSATGVTDIGNLAYATRLGLWGPQCSFASFRHFRENMERRGLGALEMLAMELKAKGSYVSRGLGWKGAEFDTKEVKLPVSMVAVYNKAVDFYKVLRQELEKATILCGHSGMCKADKCKDGHACSPMRHFWGQQQRFFREMTSAAKVKFVVAQAKEALADGMSVVIGLQSTGESGMDKAMIDLKKRPGDNVDKLISAAYYGTLGFIKQFFPTRTVATQVYIMSDKDIEDTVRIQLEVHVAAGSTSVFDVEETKNALLRDRERAKALAAQVGVRRSVPECGETQEKLLQLAKSLDLLPSPLDALIDALGGAGEVAEMTGRRTRLVRSARSGQLRFDLRPEDQETSLNIRERELFMSGKKRVAIISDAASTGVSLHAAAGSGAAHRRRLHITLELPWSADKAIQQLGRSHRSNQASAPVFQLLVTDLGGERRFASAVAKRLASLGALTKGDRRAATGADFSSFDLDTKYGRMALRAMFTAIMSKTGLVPGVDVARLQPFLRQRTDCDGISSEDDVAELGPDMKSKLIAAAIEASESSVEDMGIEPQQYSNVSLFLSRIQGLPVHRQNLMFAYLMGAVEAVVGEARAAGLYDEGIADLRASSVKLTAAPEEVARDPATGAVTALAQVVLDRGISWEQALAKRAEAREAGMDDAVQESSDTKASIGDRTRSMVRTGTGFYRSRHTDITTQKRLVLLAVRKVKHNTLMVITRPNTGTSAYEMDLSDLRNKYERVMDQAEKIELVQKAWSQAYDSSDMTSYRGSRKVTIGLLSGSLLPFWSALEKTVTACRADMTSAEQALKVYRVVLDDGRKLVGVRFPMAVLSTLRQHLAEAVQARKDIVEAGTAGTVESVSAVDPSALRRARTPPKSIHSYFGPAVTRSEAASPSATRGIERSAAPLLPMSSAKTPRGKRKREDSEGRAIAGKITALFGSRSAPAKTSTEANPFPEVAGTLQADSTKSPSPGMEVVVVDD